LKILCTSLDGLGKNDENGSFVIYGEIIFLCIRLTGF